MKNATQFHPLRPGSPVQGSRLVGCGNLADFRAAAPLPKNAEEIFDRAVIEVALDRLTIVQDVIAAGLVYDLDNWIAVPELYWEKISRVGHAQRTMTPNTRGENQLVDREGVTLPIWATMDDFHFGVRELEASRRVGSPLDTTQATQATRRVNEAIEDAMVNGGPTVGGNSSPGLLNAPSVNTVTYSGANPAWDHASKTGTEILNDAKSMATQLRNKNYFGPYFLYVNTSYWNALQSDFKAESDKTILQRLQELQYGGAGLTVRESDYLPADRTVMLEMSSQVVDVVRGDEPTLISWQDAPGWVFHYAVMACMVPRVKDTQEDQSGIVTGNV